MIQFLNDWGARALPAGVSLLVQSVVLVAVLLVLERVFRRRLRASLGCALWLLIIVKLVLPPDLKSPTGLGYWLGPWLAAPISVRPAPLQSEPAPRLESWPSKLEEPLLLPEPVMAARPRPVLNREGWLMFGWLAGGLVLFIGMLRRNGQVQRLVRAAELAPREFDEILRETAAGFGMRSCPKLRFTQAHHSPVVCGLFRPLILLPASLAFRLSPRAFREVLLHELVHVRRRDLWLNLPQVLVQVIWWWNPLVWLVNSRIRTLREQAVDDEVMSMQPDDPASYPATLIEVARHCSARPTLALGFVGILESHRSLRFRVERLLNSPRPRRAGLGLAGWLAVVMVGLMALPMAFARRVEVSGQNRSESASSTGPLQWQPWSESAVQQGQASGRVVLVQFWAKWALASRVERAAVLEDSSVIARLQELKAVTLVADWTRADPAIAAQLRAFGRAGVPLVVIYPAGEGAPPVVLPQMLTVEGVLGALEQVTGKSGPTLEIQIDEAEPPFRIKGARLTLEELTQRLVAEQRSNSNPQLTIRSSASGDWRNVIAVLGAAKQSGVTQVSVFTSGRGSNEDSGATPKSSNAPGIQSKESGPAVSLAPRLETSEGSLSADRIEYDVATDRLTAQGNIKMSLGPIFPIECRGDGSYYLSGLVLVTNLTDLEKELQEAYQQNPELVVRLKFGSNRQLPLEVINLCRRLGINRLEFAEKEPPLTRAALLDALRHYGKTWSELRSAVRPDGGPISELRLEELQAWLDTLSNPGRTRIQERLNQIMMPEMEFDGVALPEVLRILSERSLTPDQGKQGRRGLSFVTVPSAGPAAAGELNAVGSADPIDLNRVLIRIKTGLRHVRLGDAMDAILQSAKVPLRYSIEDYGILIMPANQLDSVLARRYGLSGQTDDLFTRQFQVDHQFFPLSLAAIFRGGAFGEEVAGIGRAEPDVDNLSLVNRFLQSVGAKVAFSGYDGQTGLLTIRGSLSDLELIERSLERLKVAPPSVQFDVQFIELHDQTIALPFEQVQLDGSAGPVGLAGPLLPWPSRISEGIKFTGPIGFSGLISAERLKTHIERLRQNPATRVLADVQRISVAGERVRIPGLPGRGVDRFEFTAGLTATDLMELQPIGNSGGESINLQVTVRPNKLIENWASRRPGPVESNPEFTRSIAIPVGQSLVLGVVPDNQSNPNPNSRPILIVVTPKILDPALPNGSRPK